MTSVPSSSNGKSWERSHSRDSSQDCHISTPADDELVAAWRSGDTSAFELLMRKHFGAVWAVALAVTGDADQAEDVCQDAFIRCWQRRDQCRDPRKFRAWILTIARTVAYNHVRAASTHPKVSLDAQHLRLTESADQSVVAGSLRQHLLGIIHQVCSSEQRSVLLLKDMEGFSHREIAEHLGISETMSRRHLSDARRIVREELERSGIHGTTSS